MINQLHGHANLDVLSDYFDLFALNKLLSENKNDLNIMHMNSRSLPKNFDIITALLNSFHRSPHILAVTESWLNTNNKHLYPLTGYQSYHLTRNIRPHGGVSVFVSDKLHSEQSCTLTFVNENIEINTVKVTFDSQQFTICTVYRPHSKHNNVEQFTDILTSLIQRNTIKNEKVIILGDFNINLLEHSTHLPTNNFLASIQTLNFFPHISRPTRFPDSLQLGDPSLLDHAYTNFNGNFKSGILHYPISDHLPIFLNISLPTRSLVLNKIQFRPQTLTNKQNFTQQLNTVKWNEVLSSEDVNLNCNSFIKKLNEIYNKCFPMKTKFVSDKRLKNPWITQSVINSIKTKNNLYKDFKIGAVSELYYKTYRNTLNQSIKQAKQSYYISLFSNFRNDTRKLWNEINKLKNVHKKIDINNILYNNKSLKCPIEIAEAFNEFYTNVASNLDEGLPPSAHNPLNFLHGNYRHSMFVPPASPSDVSLIISKLKNKKGNIHEIPVSLIKFNRDILSPPLSFLINQSINTGKFPQVLKHATVIPIYKKGPQNEIGNYRPISILNVISKIFESFMKINLVQYLDSKFIINQNQFGFRQGLSTFDMLNSFTQDIYNSLDKQNSLLSIFVDFTKAFDTVRHDILVNKLSHYGIRGTVNNWFLDYLSNRTQSIKISDNISTTRNINYGVPQGSVLGPILFLIYINDLPQIFNNIKVKLFADDATLYLFGRDLTNVFQKANQDLYIFYNWCLSNRLSVNLNKTFFMLFTNKDINILPPLMFHNIAIQQTFQHKLLGVTIDHKLTFKPYISELIIKLSRNISLLYQVKEIMPNSVLKIMYNAHILPYLQYCMPVWCNTYPTHLLSLFRMQKKALRIITNSTFYEHTHPLFKETQILKLFDLNKLQIATHMYKNIDVYRNLNIQVYHNYPVRTRNDLRIPIHNLTIYQHSLAYTGPKIWNSLPDDIKNSLSIHSFKKQYKKHLIALY